MIFSLALLPQRTSDQTTYQITKEMADSPSPSADVEAPLAAAGAIETEQNTEDDFKVVDAELKAHITNLVSALGGPDVTLDNRPYKLGDDALACLRDLKKWLRVFDERQGLLDVARAISQTSLVTFDLLEILSQWDLEEEARDRQGVETTDSGSGKRFRIALACLELLVPLTWPITLDVNSTPSYFYHAPSLRMSYLSYKHAILTHPKQRVFRAVIRLCLPALQADPNERSARDEGILKLAVYFIRNILKINLTDEPSISEDIARSNEISVLAKQSVLSFLAMLGSGVGETFKFQSVPVMECLYYIVYGLKMHQIMDIQLDFTVSELSKPHQDLKDLLTTEKSIRRNIQRAAPSRHNRFGTLLSVQTPDNGRLTVSGQPALFNTSSTLDQLDAKKTWRRPRRVDVKHLQQWDVTINLTEDARAKLKVFVEEVLESAYNPLFISLRKIFEKELGEYSKTLLPEHQVQFLYLVSWFLEAERAKNVVIASKPGYIRQALDFGNVAGTLNQNTFIIVMNSMRTAMENKEWHVVYASMLCFKEILNAVDQMEQQGTEEMQDMAETIKGRLFYEEYSLDLLARIPRIAHTRDISFLNLTVELTHIVLKALERYATDKQTIFIRAKRQTYNRRKKKKEQQETDGIEDEDENESDSEVERRKTQQTVRERKFNFEKFETKFMNEDTLDTYLRYLSNYKELNHKQIMFAIKFFHRIFAKRKLHYYFYRLDLMKLFNEMVGSDSNVASTTLSRTTQKEVEKFVRYYMNKLTAALEQTPSLFVELLFQKASRDVFYFENGFDKPEAPAKVPKSDGQAYVFTEEEYTQSEENRFAIVVAHLIDDDKTAIVEWIVDALGKAYAKRAAWIDLSAMEPGDTPSPPEERELNTNRRDTRLTR